MFKYDERHKEFLISRGVTEAEIAEYETIQNTPLDELLSRYEKPLNFEIALEDFFKEMMKLGWKKEEAESRVKCVLPDTDDNDNEVLPLRQFLYPPEKEVYLTRPE